jgi:hypothetical protein
VLEPTHRFASFSKKKKERRRPFVYMIYVQTFLHTFEIKKHIGHWSHWSDETVSLSIFACILQIEIDRLSNRQIADIAARQTFTSLTSIIVY